MSGYAGRFIVDLNAPNYYSASAGSSLESSVSTIQSAGYQTASDVSGAISSALSTYELSASVQGDVAGFVANPSAVQTALDGRYEQVLSLDSDVASKISNSSSATQAALNVLYEAQSSLDSDVATKISSSSAIQTALDTRYEKVANFDADIGDIIAQSGSASQNSVNTLISSAISTASANYESASDMASVKSALLALVQAIANNVVLKNSDGSDFSYSSAIVALGGSA